MVSLASVVASINSASVADLTAAIGSYGAAFVGIAVAVKGVKWLLALIV